MTFRPDLLIGKTAFITGVTLAVDGGLWLSSSRVGDELALRLTPDSFVIYSL